MAIAVRNEGAKVNSNINVTPMVDVMLVLLIIFMVITPMLQNKVNVDMAKVTTRPPCLTPTRKTPSSSRSRATAVFFWGRTRSHLSSWATRFATNLPTSRANRSSFAPMRAPVLDVERRD
jgi:biopolymer transport protein ExbD